jgi:starch phosphorylase
MNGVLNLSILDGWFDEAYDLSGGWAIGERAGYSEDQDEIHASSIYSILENEILPLYYHNQEADQDVPAEWVRRMKTSIANITPRFSCGRMVTEYLSELYQPSHKMWLEISENNFEAARTKSMWDSRISETWSRIRFVGFGEGPGDQVMSGSAVPVKATVDLAGLSPSEVRVEAVVGQIGINGELQDTYTLPLKPKSDGNAAGSEVTFEAEFTVQRTGRLGYSVRIGPNHFDNPLTRPCNAPLKWVSD